MTSLLQTMLLVFVITLAITFILTPLTIKIAPRIKGMDIPKDDRRMHDKPIPRVGGIAIFCGVTAGILILLPHTAGYLGILGGGAVIFALGLIDDMFNLKPAVKLIGQTAGAVIAFAAGTRIEFIQWFSYDRYSFGLLISLVITVIWLVGITNAINLIDGMDGLAAGVVAIASLCIAYVAYIHGTYAQCLPLLAVAGGSLGFLPWNFYPARTFMGDCGSQYLGFMIAAFSITGLVKRATVIALVIPLLVLGLPLLDTVYAIFRRLVRGQKIMQADKEHIHHDILRSGMGQRRSVILMYGLCIVMGTAAVLLSRELYVECTGLCVVALGFIYMIIADRNRKVSAAAKETAVSVEKQKGKEEKDTGEQ